MAQDLVSALEAEIESLEVELREDLRFVRLQTLRHALALYTDPDSAMGQIRQGVPTMMHSGNVVRGGTAARQFKHDLSSISAAHRAAGRRTSVEKSQALDATVMLLRNRNGPVPTREILDHLLDLGIEIGGASPLNNLSATLSNSDRFKSMGRLGWLLNEVEASAHSGAKDTDPNIYKKISMEFIDEQTEDGLSQLASYVEFNSDLPDSVKDELYARFKWKTDYDYDSGSGKFYEAFIRELQDATLRI
ncbi:hypothetical protein MKK64_26945 [Methylobacterium sp. E-025]|uniref:hypothetical protein n=1 Tax=Methylobacterium sp. E-025 TaxID=2836561 RepID=UPI001FB9F2E8|nr:hypothetical protein [Methylobacterium sp. E-025]MCJ2114803.1 hypothetical protein [Methylobacterium sp. E-025]